MKDLARLGIRDEALETEPEAYEVWQENEQALEVFLGMGTQWKREAMSGQIAGMDYPALVAVMDMLGVESDKRPEMFHDMRAMEHEVLKGASKRGK